MIGSAYAQTPSEFTSTDYTVVITPTQVNVTTSNGTYTSTSLTASVYNGVGPYTYEWRSSPDINFSEPENNITEFTTNGFNETKTGAVICIVTDTGNLDAEVTGSCPLTIVFS